MKKRKFIVLSLILFMLFVPVFPCLTISTKGSVKSLFMLPEGGVFQLGYLHSVNKSPVWDTVQRRGSKLYVTESRFYSFGAGIPTVYESSGATLSFLEDCLLLSGFEREFDEIGLYVGRIAQHELKINHREYKLEDLAEPGSLVKIHIKKMSVYNILLR